MLCRPTNVPPARFELTSPVFQTGVRTDWTTVASVPWWYTSRNTLAWMNGYHIHKPCAGWDSNPLSKSKSFTDSPGSPTPAPAHRKMWPYFASFVGAHSDTSDLTNPPLPSEISLPASGHIFNSFACVRHAFLHLCLVLR